MLHSANRLHRCQPEVVVSPSYYCAAEIISLLGEQSCFADADLSKFGYGSKVNHANVKKPMLILLIVQV